MHVLKFCLPAIIFFLTIQSFCFVPYSEQDPKSCLNKPKQFQLWCFERAKRENEINEYYKAHSTGAEALLSNINGGGQFPYILFRLFPELFPEIWGTPEEKFFKVGLGPNPYDKKTLLPMGMAAGVSEQFLLSQFGQSSKITLVNFTCVGCHSGQVQNSEGKILPIIGAPNTRVDNLFFIFAKTTKHEKFNAENFRNLLRSKPEGWFYQNPELIGREQKEVQLLLRPFVLEEILTKFEIKANLLLDGFSFLREYLYAKDNSPNPFDTKRGSLDGLIPTYLTYLSTVILNPLNLLEVNSTLPKQAAEVDTPSIWKQRKKGGKHWDGTQEVDLHRNIGAAAANLNSPIDIENVNKITDFTSDLPADPYPFDIDLEKASQGKTLFIKNCAYCHSERNQIFTPQQVGTDPNRVLHFTKKITGFQGQTLSRLCNDNRFCLKSNGASYKINELVSPAKGYAAGSLEGIWARAPYGHNGSIPTLFALLTNKRPSKFYRGALTYDTEKVGFTWDKNLPGTILFDTNLDGNLNSGHNSPEVLGQAWSENSEDLKNILEYLKTL